MARNEGGSSSLYSNGYPKVKTILAMGKEGDIQKSEIPRAHKRYKSS